ncbi:short neuropeptide F isoform X2 [Dendroctonus ponderosae]
MNINNAMKVFSLFVALMLFIASATSAPSYSGEYESSIRELIEMLIQREKENGLEDSRVGYHTVSRKAGRSPQLRLRFGKRMDSQFPVPAAYITGLNDITNDN